MSSGQFCPRCGEPIERPDRSLPGNPTGQQATLCDACYFDSFELVAAPDELVVHTCAQCGAVERGAEWVDVGAADYTDVAIEETTEALSVHVQAEEIEWGVEPEQIDQNTIKMHCLFRGIVRETVLEEETTVQVRFNRGTCTRCSRIAGDYYASTVQVRATDRTPTDDERKRATTIAQEIVETREETGDRNAFITEIAEDTDGTDIRLSTTQLGRAIADHIQRALGGEITDSRTLITEDEDGNEVYRVTYAVRLPPYPPGTIVEPADDDPVLVQSAHGNLKGVRLTTGSRYEADAADGIDPDVERRGTLDDAVETTVVTIEDEHAVQVLDPDTFAARTIARPSYLDPGADTVHVVSVGSNLYVLPSDAIETE